MGRNNKKSKSKKKKKTRQQPSSSSSSSSSSPPTPSAEQREITIRIANAQKAIIDNAFDQSTTPGKLWQMVDELMQWENKQGNLDLQSVFDVIHEQNKPPPKQPELSELAWLNTETVDTIDSPKHDQQSSSSSFNNDNESDEIESEPIDYMQEFKTWLKDSQFPLQPNVDLATDLGPEGNGVVAVQPVAEGDQIFLVPRDFMLSTGMASEEPELAAILKTQIGSSLHEIPSLLLAIQLLWELQKGNKGKLWNYITILPHSFDIPLFWNGADFNYLSGSPALFSALKFFKSMCQNYAFLQRIESKFHLFTFPLSWDLFRWAISVVITRQNAIPSKDGSSNELALIPLWDMCNHSFGSFTTQFDLETQSLQCFAQSDFAIGDQVYMHYGDRNNTELMIYSGFVVENNPFDAIQVDLPSLSVSDPLFSQKLTWLLDMNVDLKVMVNSQGPVVQDNKVWAYARLYNMDEDCCEETGVELADVTPDTFFKSMGPKNNAKCVLWINDICDQYLKKFDTSLMYDLQLLGKSVQDEELVADEIPQNEIQINLDGSLDREVLVKTTEQVANHKRKQSQDSIEIEKHQRDLSWPQTMAIIVRSEEKKIVESFRQCAQVEFS